ncbi:MAG: DNA glycosylase [Verrucomicrobiota bacterium]
MPGKLKAPNFDLAETLDSGQVFHWSPSEHGGFIGCIGENPVRVEPCDEQLLVWPTAMKSKARIYFRLDEDHEAVLASFPKKDKALQTSVAFCPGLRIIRQPHWECLATFITSSLKQVAHIRQISLELRREFGQKHQLDGEELYSYPTSAAFVKAGDAKLRKCGVGYRATGLLKTAEKLENGMRLKDAENLNDKDALEFLCGFHGVGEKIANCVLLFGYGRLEAFPIDVWIERVLRERYFDGAEIARRELEEFTKSHFGPFGGYAQQYLFHHARKTKLL